MDRLEVANEVLSSFSHLSQIVSRKSGLAVSWTSHRGETITKKWMCKGQDFYPIWHNKWPHGGTASTALSQLIRWIKDLPVLPLTTWEYWTSEKIKLLPLESINTLKLAGYPQDVKCVLCEEIIRGGMDWWHLTEVSGPCCSMRSGCKQKGRYDKKEQI